MFFISKVTLFVTASIAALAAASPVPDSTTYSGNCNTGPIQCCNKVESVNSFKTTGLHQLLGLNLDGVTGLVGSQCSPITAIGVGGNKCEAAPVCCSNNSYNGLIVIGCTPINISL